MDTRCTNGVMKMKIDWVKIRGNYVVVVVVKGREVPVVIRRLGAAALPYRFRCYVAYGSLALRNQGFAITLKDAKAIIDEEIAKRSS